MHSYILICMHTRTYIFKVRACARREGKGIRGIFMGYSWGIHGVYICIGYVSGMYRVCIGTYKVRGGCAIKFRADICKFQKKAVPLWGIFEAGSVERELRIMN